MQGAYVIAALAGREGEREGQTRRDAERADGVRFFFDAAWPSPEGLWAGKTNLSRSKLSRMHEKLLHIAVFTGIQDRPKWTAHDLARDL